MTDATGIYPGMSWDDYLAVDAINISTLDEAELSALHLRSTMDHALDTDSPAKLFGRAMHARILEPQAFAFRYAVSAPCGHLVASGRRKGEPCVNAGIGETDDGWRCGVHGGERGPRADGREVITASDHDAIEAMNSIIRRHAVVRLISQHGGFETSAVWELDGLRCKGRVDKWIDGQSGCPPTILDLKKTRYGHANREAFGKEMANYAYDAKAAWYVDGFKALTGLESINFIWAVIEDSPPYAVYVHGATPEELDAGRNRYRSAFNVYRDCMRTGDWPGPSVDIDWDQALPDWHLKKWGRG